MLLLLSTLLPGPGGRGVGRFGPDRRPSDFRVAFTSMLKLFELGFLTMRGAVMISWLLSKTMGSPCLPTSTTSILPGVGSAWRPGVGRKGVKPPAWARICFGIPGLGEAEPCFGLILQSKFNLFLPLERMKKGNRP